MGVGNGDHGNLSGRSTDLLQIVQEQMGRSPNAGIDQTDLFAQEDIRIDPPVHIKVLAEGQPEKVLEGMNGIRDFHKIPPQKMPKIYKNLYEI
jgi:predicted ThiF/HesA family dinucleotide-utilizing enzyme